MRRLLEPSMKGARFRRVIVNRANLRIPFPPKFSERLRSASVEFVGRRGKYLVLRLSSGEALIMHLGMSGWFHVAAIGDRTRDPDPHDHVVFIMSSGQSVIYNDPRRFGFMDLAAPGELDNYRSLKALGPEPLSDDFDATAIALACRGKRASIKVTLLDQRVVAGLGNIYASEALHHARLLPTRRASTMATSTGKPKKEAVALAKSIKAVLMNAVKRSESPYRAGRFRVYERAGLPCLRKSCDGTIKKITQGQRSTFYCPICQK